jgi:hypothetical protein
MSRTAWGPSYPRDPRWEPSLSVDPTHFALVDIPTRTRREVASIWKSLARRSPSNTLAENSAESITSYSTASYHPTMSPFSFSSGATTQGHAPPPSRMLTIDPLTIGPSPIARGAGPSPPACRWTVLRLQPGDPAVAPTMPLEQPRRYRLMVP